MGYILSISKISFALKFCRCLVSTHPLYPRVGIVASAAVTHAAHMCKNIKRIPFCAGSRCELGGGGIGSWHQQSRTASSRATSSCRFISQPQPQPPRPAQPAAAAAKKSGAPLRPPPPALAAASQKYYVYIVAGGGGGGGGAGRPQRPTAMGAGRRSASKTRCRRRRAGGCTGVAARAPQAATAAYSGGGSGSWSAAAAARAPQAATDGCDRRSSQRPATTPLDGAEAPRPLPVVEW